MDLKETIAALEWLKVETGSLACLGCGHEHNCSTHGCAIIRSAAELLQMTVHTFPEPALLELAAQYLGTTPERLRGLVEAEKNEPLTLDELREMNGEPVYIVFPRYEKYCPGRWEILERAGKWGWNGSYGEYFESNYESMWLAYRRKPEGQQT